MSHGLLWLPLLAAFVLLAALGWLERRRQNLFRDWAEGAELAKLDGCGGARLKDGHLIWSSFEAGRFQDQGQFDVCRLELVELMALASGDAPLTDESQGRCRLRLVGKDKQMDVPFADADRARRWGRSADGTGAVRSVTKQAPAKRQRKPVTLTPQLERRRALRRQQRAQLLIQIWRVLVLLLLSTGLGWILLRHGWTLEGTNQVIVRGDTGISPDLVAKVGGFSFPQPLLEINLKTLESQLRQELPVQSAQADRRLLPARLDVQLVGQIPVARATRRLAGGMETGMVDGEGHWIQTNTKAPSPAPTTAITVEGWSADKRAVLAKLLEQRGRISDSLQTIVLHPDGAISLRTRSLGLIDLGRDSDRLVQQIDAIVQLNSTMPPHLLDQGQGSIDLSNPDRPELERPAKKPEPAEKATPGA